MSKDTIIIFQKPELYFFPHFKEIVFSPFGIPERSFRYLIYKVLYIFHIPCCSIFWGDWKKHLKTAEQVIIFDYGYQAGMETYIKKVNPSCKVCLFCWNIIDEKHKNHKLFTDKDAIYSTDKGCCETYHLKYNHIFYTRDYYQPYTEKYRNRLFFLGVDKGRVPYIHGVKKLLEECGLRCDIRLLTDVKSADYKRTYADILTDSPLPYLQYCEEIRHSGVLLDINQDGQVALTMRVLESIYFSKKLITNNRDIVHYDFYNENNIYLLPEIMTGSTVEEIKAFLERPFHPYSEAVLENYDFEHWVNQFQ